MVDKLPTAKDFYLKRVFPTSFENKPDEVNLWFSIDGHANESVDIMIEFAKMHVETALYIASERADLTDNGRFPYVDKASILNSYSLDNIK